MRIITGKARGIQLNTLEGLETRPTAERVKEAVFSMLQFDIEGRDVLDLFSGSGQMGLEALSRGASHAVFVDKSPKAIKIIKDNAKKTKLEQYADIWNCDSLDYIKRNKGKRFDIIFLDPPYSSGLYAPILKALRDGDMLKPSTIIVCESDFQLIFEENAELDGFYQIKKTSKYSKTVITFIEPKI